MAYTVAWYLAGYRRGSPKVSRLLWIGSMVVLGFAALMIVMSCQVPPETVWDFVASRRIDSIAGQLYLPGLIRAITSHEVIFAFIWLLPLGLPRLRCLPRTWIAGALCAGFTALALGAFDDALGNTARPMFSALGPILSLSAALFLVRGRVEHNRQ